MRTLSLVLSVSICVAASALSSGCGGSSSSGGFSSSGAYLRTPAWSRDGRHLAFVRFLNGYNAIYVMDRDGSHPRRLTGARQDLIDELSSQAWSPDGRKLAFARGPNMSTPRGPTSIFVMNANGTGLRQLTRNNRDDDPAWSPDGPRIAFARYGSTNYGSIYVMNSDGSKERRLATSSGHPTPAWSPNGQEIAFEDPDEGITIVRMDGKEVKYLEPSTWNGESVVDYEPTWSPDGRKIAFVADTDPGQEATTWIEVRSVGGGKRKVFNRGFHTVEYPAWSPDGRQIAFGIFGKLMVMNANGTDAHALTPK
jgi:Tol biopolymer transport system component